MPKNITRRNFLQQTLAFSALLATTRFTQAEVAIDESANHVMMVGDWGWQNPTEGQSQVAAAMQNYVVEKKIRPEALMLLGDSWYGNLAGGVDSSRWIKQFENMYPESAFPGPAFSIAGNHDYQNAPTSKVEAELAYAKRATTAAGRPMRWRMPSLWYRFELPSTNPVMTVLALDSNVPGHGSFGSGFYTMTDATRQEQLQWLRAELDKPRNTPFLAIMAHHPMYSNGKHGDHDLLIHDWDALLRQHGVHFYFAGHDHDLQHLEFQGHPTSFVCSGAGGADLYNLRQSQAQRGPFAQRVYGFSHLELAKDKVTVRHIDERCSVLHAFTKKPSGELTLV